MNRANKSNIAYRLESANRPAILPGFADPVHDAQRCFRTVLEALSHPGKPVPLTVLPSTPSHAAPVPASCLAGMVAIALTLCDADTPVWLDAGLDTPALRQHLRFHCGCPVVAEPERAQFAFIGDAGTMPRFERFCSGDPEYPDRSATLVIAADFAAPDRRLSGPGIAPARVPQGLLFGLAGLPPWFWEDRAMNQTGYPLGVDILFVDSRRADGDTVRMAGLPRTTASVPSGRTASGAFEENRTCMSQ